MTKNLTDAQIKGYKSDQISEKINNKKLKQPKLKMKFFTAALLVLGASAIQLDALLEAKECPEAPKKALDKTASPDKIMAFIDADKD